MRTRPAIVVLAVVATVACASLSVYPDDAVTGHAVVAVLLLCLGFSCV
jgi:hypothetical protein